MDAAGGKVHFVPMAGALAITLAAAGSVKTMMGLGQETVEELNTFSKALLPTLSAAVAASGGIVSASVRQVATIFFVDLLLSLIRGLLLPLVYLYIGLLTAAACLPQNAGEPTPDRQVVYAADRAVEQQDEPQKQVEQA